MKRQVDIERLQCPAASSYPCLFGSHLMPGLYSCCTQTFTQIRACLLWWSLAPRPLLTSDDHYTLSCKADISGAAGSLVRVSGIRLRYRARVLNFKPCLGAAQLSSLAVCRDSVPACMQDGPAGKALRLEAGTVSCCWRTAVVAHGSKHLHCLAHITEAASGWRACPTDLLLLLMCCM